MDVLALTVEIGPRYPSKNHEGKDGHRFGRKSDEYRKLFDDVKAAAEREVARTGWQTAQCECFTVITRYVPHHRQTDALNIGTAEANALTAAGVWMDDRLATPCIKQIRFDDEGPHRVSIVVVKLHEPAHVRAVERNTKIEKRIPAPARAIAAQPANPARTAWVNGRAVPYEEALKLIQK